MKAKTKLQKRVVELSQNIPAITEEQKVYAFKHCFKHLAYRLKNGKTTCLECGVQFQSSGKKCVCPSCNTTLVVEDTRKKVYNNAEYYSIITRCGEFQVVRMFFCQQKCKAKEIAYYNICEVVQHWLLPNGKATIFARLRGMGYYYYDFWHGTLEIRDSSSRKYESIYPESIYPRKKIIPILKRNGFKGSFHQMSPFLLFRQLLTNNRAETLFKAKQYNMIFSATDSYWDSIKVCIRNNYIIKDSSMWCDYIRLLKSFGKDARNAKYVCPNNFKEEHDKLVAKMQKKQEEEYREQMLLNRQRVIENKKKQKEKNRLFKTLKEKFFSIILTDKELQIIVLDSAKEYKKEGEILNHCVFACNYHGKPESLILSARIGEERIATIELSLETFEIIQCRGKSNEDPPHNKRIQRLINKKISMFRKVA